MERVTTNTIISGYEKPKVSLSCLQCQQRKKKCDKKTPCLACKQASIVCTPISRARLPRGRHAAHQGDGDLRQRVARLEKLLSSVRNSETQIEQKHPPNHDTAAGSAWNTIGEEFVGIRELLDKLTGDEPVDALFETPETDRPQSFDLLLYSDASCFVQPHVLELPPNTIVSELVDIYLHRVDQVFKVTHTPTLRVIFFETEILSPAQEALRFAVFFTAVNSINEHECLQRFDSSKTSLSSRFQLAAEVLLSRAELLTSTDLTALQAFLIYLVGLRARKGSRAVSALLATAVRIGQSLGLDLETTSRTPFETEMRRRTWYSICILDLQTAFDSGSSTALAGGTLLGPAPLHINDADISPGDLSPARERSTLTEMTFCCATYEMFRHMRRIIHVPKDADGLPLMHQDWAQRNTIAEDCARCLEKYLRHCNNSSSFQLFTKAVCEAMLVTLRLLVRRPMYRFHSSKPPPDDDFNVLDVATDVLDQSLKKTGNSDFKPWQWFAWLKWYALAIVLAELCEHTKGSRVARAWVIAEASFRKHKEMIHDRVLWGSMERLMRKARSARGFNGEITRSGNILIHDKEMASNFEAPGETSYHNDYILSGTSGYIDPVQRENLWEEPEMFSWVNWESFVQDIGAPIELDMFNGDQ